MAKGDIEVTVLTKNELYEGSWAIKGPPAFINRIRKNLDGVEGDLR